MKNRDVIILANAGILNTTYHTLDGEHAYKMFKFRKELQKAINAYTEAYKELLNDAGIEDGQNFEGRIEQLQKNNEPTKEEKAELDELLAKKSKFEEMVNSLLNEDVSIDCKTMPFSEYHKLWSENHPKEGRPVSVFEFDEVIDMLEGVLWHPDE